MKIIRRKQTYISNEEVVEMENLQIQYEDRDVDLDEIKKIASMSSERIQKDYDARLQEAIREHDTFYIRRKLDNVSTYDLIKMIIQKLK